LGRPTYSENAGEIIPRIERLGVWGYVKLLVYTAKIFNASQIL